MSELWPWAGGLGVAIGLMLLIAAVRYPVARGVAAATLRREPGRALLVVAGVALGTALLTTAVVLRDSVEGSVRYRATQQLGPIATLVIARDAGARQDLEALPARAGLDPGSVLPLTALTTAVTAAGFVAFEEPQAQVVEVDFGPAHAFGADPGATGISGTTPGPGEAAANADLAIRLNLTVGSRIQVHAYGAATSLTVVRILPKRGIAGLSRLDGPASSRSPDLFVAPGTLAQAWASAPAGAPEPVSVLALTGIDGPKNEAVHATRTGSTLELRDVAAEVEREAGRQAGQVSDALQPALAAGVATGLVLLVLTIAIGIDRRRRTLAELRAMGLDRPGLLALVSFESAAQVVAGAVVGAVVGLGLAAVGIVAAAKAFAPDDAPAVLFLRFGTTPGAVSTCIAQAALIGLVTATATAAYATSGPIAPALAEGPRGRQPLRGSWLASWAGRSPTAGVAFAYPRARPARAAAVVVMFAITVGSVTALLTISRSQEEAGLSSITDLGGGAKLLVTTNAADPLPAAVAGAQPGVAWVVPARRRDVAAALDGVTYPMTLVAPDPPFADHGPPPLLDRDPRLADDAAAWRAVLDDPGGVIVGADLATDATGLHGRAIRVGDELTITDPRTGRARVATVRGVARQAQFAGVDHLYAAGTLAAHLAGSTIAPDLLYVGSTADRDPERLAAAVTRLHPTQVVDAVSFAALAGDRVRARQDFLRLLVGFSAVSLLAGAVASGLVCAANVHERRHDLGVLRALGADDHRVRQVLRVEATAITVVGAIGGFAAGVAVAERLLRAALVGGGPPLVVPWAALLVVGALTLAAARGVVWVATTVSLGVQPATALRS